MDTNARIDQMYVPVTSLSPRLRAALREVRYHRQDIAVQPAATVSMWEPASDDSKGFALLVRLDTGETRLYEGSFGGWPEDAARPSPVDADRNSYPPPSNGAVVKGVMGPHGTLATIYVPREQAAHFLPAPGVELAEVDRHALYCYRSIRGGEYRRDEMARRQVPAIAVEALIGRGLLRRNAAGAVSITTAGRNAIGSWSGIQPAFAGRS